MSYTDESSDREWKNTKSRSNKLSKQDLNLSGNKPKYLQRFCDKWLKIFDPWLARCDDNPNKPFCRACQCRLDCNRCHLQRHERTSKHARNLEILISKGEGAARENLSIRQERSKYYQQRKQMNASNESASDLGMDTAEDYIEEGETETDGQFQFVQTETALCDQYSHEQIIKQEVVSSEMETFSNTPYHNTTTHENTSEDIRKSITPMKKDRMKLLMQIQKDKNDLMDSFNELISSSVTLTKTPPKEKNHVDLFFDSVSSSVKALTPKLIAEAKMRVSQLICELELRALTDSEITNSAANGSSSRTVIVSADTGNSFIVSQPTENHLQESETHLQYNALS